MAAELPMVVPALVDTKCSDGGCGFLEVQRTTISGRQAVWCLQQMTCKSFAYRKVSDYRLSVRLDAVKYTHTKTDLKVAKAHNSELMLVMVCGVAAVSCLHRLLQSAQTSHD